MLFGQTLQFKFLFGLIRNHNMPSFLPHICSLGTCEALRFDLNLNPLLRFDDLKVMGRFKNFGIGRVCPLLVVVKRLKPLMALCGTVYRLASSMSDKLVLFNMFEEWSEKFVVPHAHLFCFIFNYSPKTVTI